MSDLDIIDVESLDFSDEQTCIYKVPNDSGHAVDIVDWSLSLDWPVYDDEDYKETEQALYSMLDEILKKQVFAMPDKHKFDSRTYVKPKKMYQRPSINNLVESNPPSLNSSCNSNKYLTYNKYNNPLLRLKTFNVEANTDNSNAVKEFALKRRSMQEEESQLADIDLTLVSDTSDRLSSDHVPSKPINIDLSQPAHNIHHTFNKGMLMSDRGSLNMYQSGESLMRMSPPSLVSSLLMESGTFNPESLDGKKSFNIIRDSIQTASGRDSIDPMVTSMTLSILDEKDMSTSFLSQSTYPDNDNLMDSLPPSLVSSVNSSYIVSTTPRNRNDSIESNNVFSSATFTHLEQSQKLLSARPRHQPYHTVNKKDNPMRTSSYVKSREEGCQIDNGKVLNENIDKKDSKTEMIEAVTVHYSNNRFWRNKDAEKENLDASFEKDDTFYKDMGIQKTVDLGKNSLNVTLDKQELNEIIQARQKLSMARKALPTEPLPNQVEIPPPNAQVYTVLPKKSMENLSELLSRRRMNANGYDKEEVKREPPKRNATFKKHSPRGGSMDTTVVYVQDAKEEEKIIDINSATMNLIDAGDKTLQQEEWGSQERAMVGSSESTDTATFSSSSPPESVPDTTHPTKVTVASTPLVTRKDGTSTRIDLLNLHNTISPIYSPIDHKSYTVTKAPSNPSSDSVNINATVINTATILKKTSQRDPLRSPEKKIASPPTAQIKSPVKTTNTASYTTLGPPPTGLRKFGLPSSKFRQYSSHKELRMLSGGSGPGGVTAGAVGLGAGLRGTSRLARRSVYASNPLLSPTAHAHAHAPPALPRTDSYTIMPHAHLTETEAPAKPVLPNPPPLVRQGTETLRRERPQSQMIQPKDLRSAIPSSGVPVSMRNNPKLQPSTRPFSIAVPQRLQRPSSGPGTRVTGTLAATASEARPQSNIERASALPRPSRLPAPRTRLRPPSVYSAGPTTDADPYQY